MSIKPKVRLTMVPPNITEGVCISIRGGVAGGGSSTNGATSSTLNGPTKRVEFPQRGSVISGATLTAT